MAGTTVQETLVSLRRRADEDFLGDLGFHGTGRHTAELGLLGVKVTLTRARYPNRPNGMDMYAITISRIALDHRPGDPETFEVLGGLFGDEVERAEERNGGPLVRMFRLPAHSS
ncbi:MAG: hypothetical protein ACP5OR_06130 [Candidatus Dormibacteria bacterium]